MMVVDGLIRMSDAEWLKFQELCFAPWRPRSQAEFDAMCDLAKARHIVDNTNALGHVIALSIDGIKFGPNGEINFPEDQRRLAYAKVHGTWATDAELAEFDGQPKARPTLSVVSSS